MKVNGQTTTRIHLFANEILCITADVLIVVDDRRGNRLLRRRVEGLRLKFGASAVTNSRQ